MLRSLTSGVSGLQQFQEELDVIGNNIANVNTIGFKSANVDFEDTLSQTLSGPGVAGSMQVGTGVTTAAISNEFTQGAIANTGINTNLAINGNGFFTVTDPSTGAQYATRAGNFVFDQSTGSLETPGGFQVMGYTDAGLSTVGAIKIDATGAPATAAPGATVSSFNIGSDGKINVTLSDGTQFVRGQVLLQNYSNPQALNKAGNNLYSNLTSAGPLSTSVAPGSSGLGSVQSSALEGSNVDLASEFANMIIAQRGFQANARVITTSDQILQELVDLKR